MTQAFAPKLRTQRCRIDVKFPPGEVQVAVLDAEADCVKSQWFSIVLPPIPLEASKVLHVDSPLGLCTVFSKKYCFLNCCWYENWTLWQNKCSCSILRSTVILWWKKQTDKLKHDSSQCHPPPSSPCPSSLSNQACVLFYSVSSATYWAN